ncbi:MAG TPA: OadG family transporter subunit [Prolixibacteraceae bacterium]|nr:OadG family transporter subunit [Prolixibacteraceae bacterium]
MNDMGIALELLGVGMVTVFLILSLVVILGNLIIRFVNRFIPDVQNVSGQLADVVTAEIHPKKIAAIVSAVKIVTKGTGRITSIKKI